MAIRQKTWVQNCGLPTVNLRASRHMLRAGEASRATGVDGRFQGEYRRFPGFRNIRTLSQSANFQNGPDFFQSVALEKGGGTGLLRGWVYRYQHTDDTWRVHLDVYDTESDVWRNLEINSNVGTVDLSASSNRRYLYVAVGSTSGYSIYWDTATPAFVSKTLGVPAADLSLTAPVIAPVGSGGKMEAGTYLFAYRFKDSVRNLYSGLSVMTEATCVVDDSYTITWAYTATQKTNYDTVQIFRTITSEVAGSMYAGGLLYLEEEVDIDTGEVGAGPYTGTDTTGDVFFDEQLVQLTVYDPVRDQATIAPQSGIMRVYQGSTFMGGPESGTTGSGLAQIRWSALHAEEPEAFPDKNVLHLPDVSDRVVEFVEAGDTLYGVANNLLWRLQKIGGRLTVTKLHHGRGVVSRSAAHGVGRDLLVVTDSGAMIVDSQSGTMTKATVLDRLLQSDQYWGQDHSHIYTVYDGELDASFIVNRNQSEAAVLWWGQDSVTTLEDMNFETATQGPHPENGGNIRAWFVDTEGHVYTPDAFYENTKHTMKGIADTVNGTATGGDADTLIDSTATFASKVVGCELHILSGVNKGEHRTVSVRNSATSIDVSSAFSNPLVVGVRYALSPIPFRVRQAGLGIASTPPDPKNNFRRRVAVSVGVFCTYYDGAYDPASDVNALLNYKVYRNGEITASGSAEKGMSANPADTYKRLEDASGNESSVDGGLVEPEVVHLGSDCDFALLSTIVFGKLGESKEYSG